jgi:hypothetical protein
MIELQNSYMRQYGHLAGYISTNKCAGIVECWCYRLQLNRSVNPKWQFLACATIAFSERYIRVNQQVLAEIKLCRNKLSSWNSWVPFEEPLGFAEHILGTSIIIYKSSGFAHSVTAVRNRLPQNWGSIHRASRQAVVTHPACCSVGTGRTFRRE